MWGPAFASWNTICDTDDVMQVFTYCVVSCKILPFSETVTSRKNMIDCFVITMGPAYSTGGVVVRLENVPLMIFCKEGHFLGERERETERERDRQTDRQRGRKRQREKQRKTCNTGLSLRTGGQGHPTPIHTPTPTHKHLDHFFSTRTDRQTNRLMDGLTDKASHGVRSWNERETVPPGCTIITWDISKFK